MAIRATVLEDVEIVNAKDHKAVWRTTQGQDDACKPSHAAEALVHSCVDLLFASNAGHNL